MITASAHCWLCTKYRRDDAKDQNNPKVFSIRLLSIHTHKHTHKNRFMRFWVTFNLSSFIYRDQTLLHKNVILLCGYNEQWSQMPEIVSIISSTFIFLVDSLHLWHEFHSDYMDYGLTKWNFYNIHFWKIGWVCDVSFALSLSCFCIRMLVFVHEFISIRMSMLVSIRLPLKSGSIFVSLAHSEKKSVFVCVIIS